jgi:hypothetical protein
MTTDHAHRKPGSCKEQIVQIPVDFGAPLDLTPIPAAVSPQTEEPKEKKEWPLTPEEQNEIMVLALKDIVGICMMFDYPPVDDLFSIAQRALKSVGRESESWIVRQR